MSERLDWNWLHKYADTDWVEVEVGLLRALIADSSLLARLQAILQDAKWTEGAESAPPHREEPE